MSRLVVLVICLFIGNCTAKTSEEIFLENYAAAINASGIPADEILVSDVSAVKSRGYNFNCPSLPDSFINKKPTSVHELTPYNIKVVGAVGDSVTAGFGALSTSIFNIMTEYRGVSWSIGGDKSLSEVVTVPNIFREFNEDVTGYSKGKGYKATDPRSHFNQAVSGAVAEDIPEQVTRLIELIKNDDGVNVDEDWKLITIWIGGNDLCEYCNEKTKRSPENYVKYLKESIDKLRDELPRTFVSLVQTLDVTELGKLPVGPLCGLVHLFACSCKNSDASKQAATDYNLKLEEMMESYDDTSDFAVVLQPFFKNVKIPAEDPSSYFGLDCFHFNGKGHEVVAKALWNNMLAPVGSKATTIDWENQPDLECPTEDSPYLYTRQNSASNSFGGAANPNEPNSTPDSTPSNLLGIVLGTSLSAFVVAMAIVVGIVAVIYARRQRRQYSGVDVRNLRVSVSMDTEKTRLIFSQ